MEAQTARQPGMMSAENVGRFALGKLDYDKASPPA